MLTNRFELGSKARFFHPIKVSLDVLLIYLGESASICGLGPHSTLYLNINCGLVKACDGAISRQHDSWSTCVPSRYHVVLGLVDCSNVEWF